MTSNLELLRRDLVVADACQTALGDLTASVRGSLASWFRDLDAELVFPLPEMPMTAEERRSMTGLVVREMLAAVTEVASRGLGDEDSFEALAPVVDPLWKEIIGLSAPLLNEVWRSNLPEDDEDREERIRVLETMTGLGREELVRGAVSDRRLRGLISRLGLRTEDLN
jgi:hypothetical protein